MLTSIKNNVIILSRGVVRLEKISERIKLLRKDLKISQTEFGKRLGVSQSVIANIEGDRLARPDQKEPLYKLICKEFGVNEEWLIYGTSSMYEYEDDEYARAVAEIAKGDRDAQEAIIKYWQLPEEDKKAFWNFLRKIVS